MSVEPFVHLREIDTPAGDPRPSGALLYVKDDGELYLKDDAGAEHPVGDKISTAQQAALNLKANIASPTFTGNPKAPTPATSDSDTSIATTAFVQAAIAAAITAAKLAMHPVGSLYFTETNSNPGTFLGGTWAAWGSGRVPVGIDTSQTEFDAPGKTGGEKSHMQTVSEVADHAHFQTTGSDAGFLYVTSGQYTGTTVVNAIRHVVTNTRASGSSRLDLSFGRTNVGIQSNPGGGVAPTQTAMSLLQPYVVCYMWKRTA